MQNIESRVAALEKRLHVLEEKMGTATVSKPTQKRGVSPKEFLLRYRPTSEVQTTFLLCNYSERVLGMEAFNVEDLKGLFGASRMPLPKNLNDAINKNIRKGLITESAERKGDKKSWVITLTGEQEFDQLTNHE